MMHMQDRLINILIRTVVPCCDTICHLSTQMPLSACTHYIQVCAEASLELSGI